MYHPSHRAIKKLKCVRPFFKCGDQPIAIINDVDVPDIQINVRLLLRISDGRVTGLGIWMNDNLILGLFYFLGSRHAMIPMRKRLIMGLFLLHLKA